MYKKLLSLVAVSSLSINAYATVPPDYSGVWKTDGYGWIVLIQDDLAAIGNITKDTCNVNTIYQPPEQMLADFDLSREGDMLKISAKGSFTKIKADKLPSLPSMCQTPMPNTPENNFLTFSQTMQEYYGFFDLYQVNWASRIAASQPKITPTISDEALLSVFKEMLTGINDAHVSLTVGENEYTPAVSQTESYIQDTVRKGDATADLTADKLLINTWVNSIPKQTLKQQGKFLLNNRLQYGVLSDQVGYISLFAMIGYQDNDEENVEEDIALMHVALDTVFAEFSQKNIKKIIFDVSLDRGGYDQVSLAIASRFTDKPRRAFSKRAQEAKDKTLYDINITPSKRSRFTGDVYLLTSDMTISAAEIFTLAMRALPNVTQVGQRTNGALSDMLAKRLPNGWGLTLSNELYLDVNGISWEGKGIPPAISLPVFPRDNLIGGHAVAIDTLLAKIDPRESSFSKPVPALHWTGFLILSMILILVVNRDTHKSTIHSALK